MAQIPHKTDPADIAANEYFEKERAHFKKGESVALGVSFILFLLVFLVLFFILPKKAYSKKENAVLGDFPKLTAESLFGESFFKKGDASADRDDGSRFTKQTEQYIEKHFPGRDLLFEGYSLYSLALGRGGSGGVLLGEDGYLLNEESYAAEDGKKALAAYEQRISSMAENVPLTVAVVPTGSQILTDKLPLTAKSEKSVIESNIALIRETFSGEKNYTFIDLSGVMEEHADEEIYYRTDHHWTTLGAFYGVSEIRRAAGKEPLARDHYTVETATKDFRGTLYNRSGAYWHKGERIEYYRFAGDEDFTVSVINPAGAVLSARGGFYDRSCLEEDYHGTSYDSFVTRVGQMISVTENGVSGKPKLLILKDSYAHCALPFLAEEYDLFVFDIRVQLAPALQMISRGEADEVLVLVSTDTLLS